MKSQRKKKRKVRQKDWSEDFDRAFSHDLKRHRRTDTAVSDNAPQPEILTDFVPNGVVLTHSKRWAFVWLDGAEVQCRISRHILEAESTVLAAGDEVFVEDWEGEPWIKALSPRRTFISRPAIEGSRITEQIFAANVDLLIIVASAAKPKLKPGLIDRYLVAAERGGVETVLCVNKIDLVEAAPEVVQQYRDIGIKVVETSCKTEAGLEELRACFHNRLSVLGGQSGVGKSSLLNALFPDLDIRTQTVSGYNEKGRHTTTAARLYLLDHGSRIIDTPGIRQMGLLGVDARELDFYFPEIAEHAANCRFRDCRHEAEPDCAVLDALESGAISLPRFRSYFRIRDDLQAQETHGGP